MRDHARAKITRAVTPESRAFARESRARVGVSNLAELLEIRGSGFACIARVARGARICVRACIRAAQVRVTREHVRMTRRAWAGAWARRSGGERTLASMRAVRAIRRAFGTRRFGGEMLAKIALVSSWKNAAKTPGCAAVTICGNKSAKKTSQLTRCSQPSVLIARKSARTVPKRTGSQARGIVGLFDAGTAVAQGRRNTALDAAKKRGLYP